MKNVLVAISGDSNAARELLIGLFEYANTRRDWSVRLLGRANDLTPARVDAAVAEGVDGVVTGFSVRTPGYARLIASGLNVVLNNVPDDASVENLPNVSVLRPDDRGIGAQAARYLSGKGQFRSFVFVPTEVKTWWSAYRQRGFRTELGRRGVAVTTYRGDLGGIGPWLASLPHPVGVLAATDAVGAQVVELCRRAHVAIPDQVAVLGVDNDDLVCNNVRPSLSSIRPGYRELGFRSARELDRLMRGKGKSSKRHAGEAASVIERDSTRAVPPAGHLVRGGLAFIRAHATDGISAADVARHLGVSAALLRLRFRTVHGSSVRDEILACRMEAAEKRLLSTEDAVAEIARSVGFSTANRFSHYFKKCRGVSPESWRRLRKKGQNR